MKIAFLGSSDFSLTVLKSLMGSAHQVVCVVCNLDSESGRGQKVVISPVKVFAIKNNIPVLQYKRVSKEGFDDIKSFNPDVLVTASFGQMLRQNILSLAKYGVINVHASILPKYRGSCPINWVIINGEKQTGVTIMKTDIGLDTGDIINSKAIDILEDENVESLSNRLAVLGGEMICDALDNLSQGKCNFTKQIEEKSSYYPMLNKEMAKIDFNKTNVEIKNFCNGLNPWPVAWVMLNEERLKVYKAKPEDNKWNIDLESFENGQVVKSSSKSGLVVKCANGLVLLSEIQAPNGKKMLSNAYLNGKSIDVGTQF